jgi:integrase
MSVHISVHIKETDKTVLSWDERRRVFNALSERDRLIISIEGTAGLRPSELFALRCQSFDGHRLTITETIYRGKLRSYGKTKGSLTTVDLPEELAHYIREWLGKLESKSPDVFMFPNAIGGFIEKDNYLRRALRPLEKQLGHPKLNFQILRRTFSTLAQKHGTVKDVQRQMRHAKPDITAEVYMQAIPESVQKMVADMYAQLLKPATETVQSLNILHVFCTSRFSPTQRKSLITISGNGRNGALDRLSLQQAVTLN